MNLKIIKLPSTTVLPTNESLKLDPKTVLRKNES
jgi:hypothetical protein